MTEETPPKQYLIMVDEKHMILLSNIIPGLKFIQAEGYTIEGHPDVQLIVSPIAKETS